LSRPGPRGDNGGMPRRKRFLIFSVVAVLLYLLTTIISLGRFNRPLMQTGGRATPRTVERAPVGDRTCPVLSTIDGDTFWTIFRGQRVKVRPMRIDTPEEGKLRFDEAAAALAELIGDGPVRIEFETPGKEKRDRWKRLL